MFVFFIGGGGAVPLSLHQKLSCGHEKVLCAHKISGAHRRLPNAFAVFLCGNDSTICQVYTFKITFKSCA